MSVSKASTTCKSTSYACLENASAVFTKFLPDRVLNVGPMCIFLINWLWFIA